MALVNHADVMPSLVLREVIVCCAVLRNEYAAINVDESRGDRGEE